MLWRLFFGAVLARLDAERAHELGLRLLRLVPPLPFRPDPCLRVEALGRVHRTPLGVAAGLDKDARVFEALGRLGFGHVEVGTVTPEPQEGNPRPRVFRHLAERALVNRMGFPSAGAARVAERLARRSGRVVVGANVSKRRTASLDEAPADCAAAARAVRGRCDYVVVNVSSPNTPGLRDLQEIDRLRAVLEAVRAETGETPLLVKISPDLADADVDQVADLAVELGLAGIVAVNTTTAHRYEQGGLSGPPLKERSLEVLRRLRARVGDGLVLVSVGGVEDAHDVWERLRAGATLVQAYTGFVYGGPLWPRRVTKDLARLLRNDAKRVARVDNTAESTGCTSPDGW